MNTSTTAFLIAVLAAALLIAAFVLYKLAIGAFDLSDWTLFLTFTVIASICGGGAFWLFVKAFLLKAFGHD